MSEKTMLLSIRREHARNIFNGIKTVELRRIKPNLLKGDQVFVYVPSPTKAIIGTFEVECVIEDKPSKLWNKVKDFAAIPSKIFNEYFADAEKGYGIRIHRTCLLVKPITLEMLRKKKHGFYPPQCYQYLKPEDIMNITGSVY